MLIRKIQLTNFRSFKTKLLEFSPKTTVIIGPNASGKTNIIESIFLLSTGKSFHARVEEEMISYSEEIARVKGAIVDKSDGERSGTNLEVVLTRGEITIGRSPEKVEKVARKKLLINGVSKRLIDFAGTFKTVLFGPWDMGLVTEAPSTRRKFLDTVLAQVDREYRRASMSYEKGLRQRNKILWSLRENPSTPFSHSGRSQLIFWDRLLIKNGDYISTKRTEFIEFVNSREGLNDQIFSLEYDRSAISEARLEQYADEEIAAASTLVGPHRDDFIFKVKGKSLPAGKAGQGVKDRELARYGSRGEQRMGILWLKLSELAFIEQMSGEKPTLLLDDIFSELDHEHRNIVFEVVKGHRLGGASGSESQQSHLHQGFGGQAIITTADPHYIEGLEKVEKIKL